MKIFLSYSSLDKDLSHALKKQLERLGLSVFLAHDDIEPSLEWQDVILSELNACDVFIPVLTDNYEDSDWTDQEAGVAIQRKVVILPLKVSVNPHGFMSRFQALPLNTEEIAATCERVLKVLSAKPVVGEAIKDSFIAVFGKSFTWASAASNARILVSLAPFSQRQLIRIVELMTKNAEVYHSFAARDILKPFALEYESALPEELFDKCWKLLSS